MTVTLEELLDNPGRCGVVALFEDGVAVFATDRRAALMAAGTLLAFLQDVMKRPVCVHLSARSRNLIEELPEEPSDGDLIELSDAAPVSQPILGIGVVRPVEGGYENIAFVPNKVFDPEGRRILSVDGGELIEGCADKQFADFLDRPLEELMAIALAEDSYPTGVPN